MYKQCAWHDGDDMLIQNRNKPIPSGFKAMVCTMCDTKFKPDSERLTVPDGGYLIECAHCGVYTKFDIGGNQLYILGMC